MGNTDFIICKANQTQRNYVLEHYVMQNEEERKNAIIYVAVDDSDKIIGSIIIKEWEVPTPFGGKCWYICKVSVRPEFRRKGIATALVDVIKKQAELLSIVYLYGSAVASVEASMFWLNQGFTMNAYGDKQENKDKPLYYGNYNHFISYRIRRKFLLDDNQSAFTRTISKDEILHIINEYAIDENRKSNLLSKADELFGFAAIGEEGEIKGAILAFPDSMQAPLVSIHWCITLFVQPECRNQGIGKSLVGKLYQYAHGKNAMQLTNFDPTEDNIGFWYKLGFDILFWGVNSQTGKRATNAMIRIK